MRANLKGSSCGASQKGGEEVALRKRRGVTALHEKTEWVVDSQARRQGAEEHADAVQSIVVLRPQRSD